MTNRKKEPMMRLWWAFMCSLICTLVVSGLQTVQIDEALSPVLMSLLSIVGPEVAFWVVLADCLAV